MIQTDGGSEFKEKFKKNVSKYCKKHRIERPYKKNEQSYIESFNRKLRKECLGWKKYGQEELKTCNIMLVKFLYKNNNTIPQMWLNMQTHLGF